MTKHLLLSLSLAVTFLAAPGLGHADEEGLRRCRGIAEAAARLACYDALPVPARGATPRPAAPAREAASPSLLERFGLETSQPQADRIESHIPGLFKGWDANSSITLANGQVWRVVDGSWLHGEWDNPKVTVRRGMFGAFFLDVEGAGRSPRVQRVR
jgi:hypothetical protein